MHVTRWQAAAVCAVMAVWLAGCEFLQEHDRAAIGAGVGALGGAVIGGIADDSDGAIIGGVIGALAGGAIGAYLDHKEKSAAETNAEYGYEPAQGLRLELSSAGVDPDPAPPGGQAKLLVTYALMAADPGQQVQVQERRQVVFGNAVVADTQTTVVRAPGTYSSIVPITLPANAAQGRYQYTVTVSAGEASQSMTADFDVGAAGGVSAAGTAL